MLTLFLLGSDILHDSLWNKGTGFTEYERSHLGLRGLLPPAYRDLEQQKKRVLRHLDTETTNEKKNLYLLFTSEQNRCGQQNCETCPDERGITRVS
jgi:hypothetical protein